MQLPISLLVKKNSDEIEEENTIWQKAYKIHLQNSFHGAGVTCPWFAAALLIGATLCVFNAMRQNAASTEIERTYLLITASFSFLWAAIAYGFYRFAKQKASGFAQEAVDSGVQNETDIQNFYASINKN